MSRSSYPPLNPPESVNPEALNQSRYIQQIWQSCKIAATKHRENAIKLQEQDVGYLMLEKQRHNNFLTEERETLLLFQGKELSKEYSSPQELALERSKLLFRKKSVAYLLDNRQKIEEFYLSEFSSRGQNMVNKDDVFQIVGAYLSAKIFPNLPKEFTHAFEQAIENLNGSQSSGLSILELVRTYPDYPLRTSTQVDLNCLQDLDVVYSDILALISGVGYSKWKRIQDKRKAIAVALISYKSHSPLFFPKPESLGVLKEPVHIFLLKEVSRLRIEKAMTGATPVDLPGLSAYIKQFDDSPFLYLEFKQWATRVDRNLPLQNIYNLICSIRQIGPYQPDFAEILLIHLESIFKQYHPSTSPLSDLDYQLSTLSSVVEFEKNQSTTQYS